MTTADTATIADHRYRAKLRRIRTARVFATTAVRELAAAPAHASTITASQWQRQQDIAEEYRRIHVEAVRLLGDK